MSHTNDLGIIVANIQQCLLGCELIKDFIVQRPQNQHIVFTSANIDDINTKFIPILPIVECRFFYGNAIVFDTDSLEIATQCINLHKILLYTTDDIWKNNSSRLFQDLRKIYTADNLIVIVKDQEQYNNYYSCWNKKPYAICEDLKYEYLSEIL